MARKAWITMKNSRLNNDEVDAWLKANAKLVKKFKHVTLGQATMFWIQGHAEIRKLRQTIKVLEEARDAWRADAHKYRTLVSRKGK
jgi:hypothetical protein